MLPEQRLETQTVFSCCAQKVAWLPWGALEYSTGCVCVCVCVCVVVSVCERPESILQKNLKIIQRDKRMNVESMVFL